MSLVMMNSIDKFDWCLAVLKLGGNEAAARYSGAIKSDKRPALMEY
jgi:hypothetical protein